MKKHALLLVIAFIMAIGFSACSEDSSAPADNNNSGNIPESEFPTTATGGDPRGTYTPNTPAASTKLPPPPTGFTFSMTYTKNTGSGTVKLEGSSATSGTYTNTNLVIEIAGIAKVMSGSTEVFSYPFPSSDPNEFNPFSTMAATGTWRVDGNKLYFNDETEGMDFTVTSKGLFAVHTIPVQTFGSAIFSIGMRKQ